MQALEVERLLSPEGNEVLLGRRQSSGHPPLVSDLQDNTSIQRDSYSEHRDTTSEHQAPTSFVKPSNTDSVILTNSIEEFSNVMVAGSTGDQVDKSYVSQRSTAGHTPAVSHASVSHITKVSHSSTVSHTDESIVGYEDESIVSHTTSQADGSSVSHKSVIKSSSSEREIVPAPPRRTSSKDDFMLSSKDDFCSSTKDDFGPETSLGSLLVKESVASWFETTGWELKL